MSEALRHVGLEKYEQWQAWRVLAAVLHLGDVGFGGDDVAEVDDATLEALRTAAALLGLELEPLRLAFVSRATHANPDPNPHPKPNPNPNPTPAQVSRTIHVAGELIAMHQP